MLEKASGQVKRVINDVIQATPVLDLAVNFASERGLLAMGLHPNFPATPQVFIRWTESSTGLDTNVTADVPLLGNRIDRYTWNGSALTLDTNILMARALQTDNMVVPGQPANTANLGLNGNHNGGPSLRARRQAVCVSGRSRPTRLDAEPGQRALPQCALRR